MKNNEMVYGFQVIDTDIPQLFIVEPPTTEAVAPKVASCKCGLLVPIGVQPKHRREGGHFLKEPGKDHSECTESEQHTEIVYNTLYDDVMNGQEAFRRLNNGDESVIEP